MRRLTPGLAIGAALATIVVGVPAATAVGTTPATALPAASSPGPDHAALGLASDEKLVARSVLTDRDGTQHVRYDRTWKGLRVLGGDLVVEKSKAGAVESVRYNANRKDVSAPSTTPKVAKSSAVAAGAERSRATGEKSQGELVVWAGSGSPRLAYDVVTTGVKADQTPSRLHTVVDASSGAVISSWDEIVNGTGNSMYSGTVTLNTTQSGSTWQLKDSIGNYTTDLNGSTSSTAAGTLFTDADNVWGTGAASSRQTAGVDAQYGAEKTYAYYNTQLGRAGIWNNGTGARSRVHYGNAYVNAFWDGTQMTYGDGSGNTHPLTSIDVAAHEMSHGVTENTAGLAYTGDAGGLNEATSDIFGTAVEFYANSAADPGDYLIGEKININGNGTPLRYMDKPSKDGASQDCWTTGTKNLDPHYSSGPLNHWFYLASEGSGAKTVNGVSYNSPTCNGSTVTGAGRTNIEKVWYRTLSTKLTSTSNYAAAREGAIASAKELFPSNAAVCTAVESAFSAISVPVGAQSCGGGTTPPPTGGNILQNAGFESGATVWTGTAGPVTNNTGRPARTGSWKMWLGGNGSAGTETEQQTVTIPATATSATLSFWVRIDTSESGTTAYDTMRPQVVVGGTTTTLATYSNANANGSYVQKSFNLIAYKGKAVTVKFTATEDSSLQTSFVVDDTALTVG
ncbi:M4 family metallopeptidase [Phycicoccus sonneratiae]|uniref:Neutral metalloproteinase n=1 Tax=Phycicoccus sonneratiae TaxID=2807628 RepID=A0ABS2CQ54_9MICO|nr:M4 family metallopeptidase [Phycicoccus sonneraticus]MBM6402022.1 M4 family metallopeptidase [Phycicoccus sonneraticus]